MTSKSTKRALLTSVLALLMCVTMLIGTTFAWFTDTASTGVNKITSGNLHVEIQDKEGRKIETLKWVDKDGNDIANQEGILWEPGCTYLLTPFQIVNTGNLALKYKIVITGLDGDSPLLDVIKFTYKTASGEEFDMSAEGHLTAKGTPGASTGMITVSAHMDKLANNDYMDKTLTGIKFTVYATQDTVENDSYNNQYDKNAQYLTYPAGVTTESFPESVEYEKWPGNTGRAEAVAAYVDSNGTTKYAADIANAIKDGATTIYLKKDADVKAAIWGTNRTPDLTNDLTIYANGADFQYGEIALNSTTTAANDITVKVYDAKNLYVWGYSPAGDKAATVLMENCHNIGVSETSNKGRMFYISNDNNRTNGTIHATLRSCSVEKSNSPVYMNADGSLTLENCTFIQCAVPVNNNYKSAGTRTDVVKDCKFISCGCTAEMSSAMAPYAAPIRFFKSGSGTLTVTLENNTFEGTIGTNGDILLGDYRTPGKSLPFNATIVTANPVMVKSSAAAAYSYNGGTVNVLDY